MTAADTMSPIKPTPDPFATIEISVTGLTLTLAVFLNIRDTVRNIICGAAVSKIIREHGDAVHDVTNLSVRDAIDRTTKNTVLDPAVLDIAHAVGLAEAHRYSIADNGTLIDAIIGNLLQIATPDPFAAAEIRVTGITLTLAVFLNIRDTVRNTSHSTVHHTAAHGNGRIEARRHAIADDDSLALIDAITANINYGLPNLKLQLSTTTTRRLRWVVSKQW